MPPKPLQEWPVNTPQQEGIWLINKPLEWTSFNVVKKVRTLLKGIKTGHAGTLDPLATGLVIVCTGKATKSIESIQALAKEYTGTFTLGATTASYDLETPVEVNSRFTMPTEQALAKALEALTGVISQVPPVYSALKMGGKRAYTFAREGTPVAMKSREVTVHSFEVTQIEGAVLHFRVRCSKGTYIRSLAHDLGELLGTGAYLSSLCRTQIGDFTLGQALSIAQLEEQIKGSEVRD